MSTIISTASARAEHEEDLRALEARWPQFSVRELYRLRFLLYLRRTGRIQSPAPVRVDTEVLCAALLGGTSPPAREALRPQSSRTIGVPPLWAAWAAQQRTRQQRTVA